MQIYYQKHTYSRLINMQPTINYTNMDLTQVWILYIYGSYTDMDLMDEIFVYFPNFVHSHFQDYTHYESTK